LCIWAGFMGYGEAAGLTEAVRRRPAGVVLFDEVEKVRMPSP
jgi:ATP-dependent Clp protease ATP-binding subunit ClpA